MRIFSGSRVSGGGKKTSASDLFKKNLYKDPKLKQVEKTPDEKYKEVLEGRLFKMMEDALSGKSKRNTAILPGTKMSTAPKPMSTTVKKTLEILVIKKMKLEAKKEKRKLYELQREEKRKQNAEYYAQLAQQEKAAAELREQQEREAAAAAAAYQASKDESGGGWW